MRVPQFTLDDYEKTFADRHLLHHVVAKWAKVRPETPAIVSAESDRTVSWSEFDRTTTALAGELQRMGFAKGDFLVTLLPFSVDHVLLEYSCFKLGVIVAPLDLRLSAAEIIRSLEILRPRGFAGLGVKGPLDLRPLWNAVREKCDRIKYLMVMDSEVEIPGTISYASVADAAGRAAADAEGEIDCGVSENDGALVIFTTGSTGSPKPALLSHRNITVQNMCMCGAFFGGDNGSRTLVNLPPSHVGGQTEAMMSTFFGGGTAVLLEIFDAGRSLRAIEKHRVEILGQIPAMFNLEWMLKDYAGHDLSSLRFAAYGGHSVSRPFVDQLAAMAPVIGTGLGLTEAAGFCTYIQAGGEDRETILTGLGVDMPVYPCTIRKPMRDDGNAGDELPAGEIGQLCFSGPQSFLGYVNDAEATARAISRDGYLYTGDLGFKDAAGLHLTGREKWVIKSFGYQIFPGDVEAHICTLKDKVANCVAVGVAHEVVSEAVVALVEKKPGVELSTQELDRHARTLPTYMRPRHWILLEPGQMPLNRVVKPDYGRAQEMARQEIAGLRARGEWDGGYSSGEMKSRMTRPALPKESGPSKKIFLRLKALGPVRLISYFDLQAIVFFTAFLIVLSRRPDAVLKAQFYAEDGAAFYPDAYYHGLHTLFMPYSGYLQTLYRAVALITLLFPLYLAPLVMNLCAIAIQILPVNFFLSSRFSNIPLKTRLLGSLLYLAIPNAAEIHANITNAQCHLGLLACLALLARPASGWGWRIFDGVVLVLTSISCPLGIVLVPLAAAMWWKRQQRWSAYSLALLLPGTLVTGIVALFSHQRQVAPNGATFSRFAAILGRQVFLSSLLGRNTQDWLLQLRYVHLIEGIATVVGLAVLLYALRYGQTELKLFVVFGYAELALALVHPLAGPPDHPQWESLCIPGCGNRYYFLPMLAFLACLLWMAGRRASARALRSIAAALLLILPLGIYRDWKYSPFDDLHFSQYADQFKQAPAGTTMVIPINPGWKMELTKH